MSFKQLFQTNDRLSRPEGATVSKRNHLGGVGSEGLNARISQLQRQRLAMSYFIGH